MSKMLFDLMTPDDINYVVNNLWLVERQEAFVYGLNSNQDIEEYCYHKLLYGEIAYAGRINNVPVCVCGANLIEPGLYRMWFICTDSILTNFLEITRQLKRLIEIDAERIKAQKIELYSATVNKKAGRWFDLLVFYPDHDYNHYHAIKRFVRNF